MKGYGRAQRLVQRRETPAWRKLTPSQRKKALRWQCIRSHCRNTVSFSRGKLVCCTCSSRDYDRRNPVRVKWNNLKKSARKRGIEFHLFPFEAFELWAAKYGYTDVGQRGAEGLTVDRENEYGHYTWDNISTKTNCENARKSAQVRRSAFCPWSAHYYGTPEQPF